MHCAAYGLSTDRLTSCFFNLCSNAGSTDASVFEPNFWIWCRAQGLSFFGWPYHGLFQVEPVIKRVVWPWPPCYSSVSGCYQSSYILGHLCVEQQFYFHILRECFAIRLPCWRFSSHYERIVPKAQHLTVLHNFAWFSQAGKNMNMMNRTCGFACLNVKYRNQ